MAATFHSSHLTRGVSISCYEYIARSHSIPSANIAVWWLPCWNDYATYATIQKGLYSCTTRFAIEEGNEMIQLCSDWEKSNENNAEFQNEFSSDCIWILYDAVIDYLWVLYFYFVVELLLYRGISFIQA